MKAKFFLVTFVVVVFAGCSRLEVIREEVCRYRPEIVGAVNLICSLDSTQAKQGMDSLAVLIEKVRK